MPIFWTNMQSLRIKTSNISDLWSLPPHKSVLIFSLQNLLVEQSARRTSEQLLRRDVSKVVTELREHLSDRLIHSITGDYWAP